MRILFVLALLGLLAYLGTKGVPFLPSSPPPPGAAIVEIYMDPAQAVSWDAERYFASRGYQVRVRDIRADAIAHSEYVRLGGGELPVIHFSGERIQGFREWEVQRLVDRYERARLLP